MSGAKKEFSKQSERFTETARRLNSDEDEAAFKEKLGVIARQKPKQQVSPTADTEPKRRTRKTMEG